MTAKRQATSILNHDNWDEEDEPEERGTFRTAPNDELSKRVIKKARRKITGRSSDAADSSTSKSVFTGFTGFGKPSASTGGSLTTSTNATPFSFLSKLQAETAPSMTSAMTNKPTFQFCSSTSTASTQAETAPSTTSAMTTKPNINFCSSTSTGLTQAKTAPSTSTNATQFSFLSKLQAETAPSTTSAMTNKPIFKFCSSASTDSTQAEIAPSTTSAMTTKTNFNFCSSTSTGSTQAETAPSTTSPMTNKPNFKFCSSTSTDSDANKTSIGGLNNTISYYAKLKGLNQAVSDWIKTHVDKNPLCILTPIFKDYEKYLEKIKNEKENQSEKEEKKSTAFSFGSSTPATSTNEPTTSQASTSIFASLAKPTATQTTNGFSFGLKTDNIPSTSAASSMTFNFGSPPAGSAGSTNDKKAATAGFSFTSGAAPFTFANVKPPVAVPQDMEKDEDDEQDQPPKNEFKQVVEDDAVFSQKCKVFVKKDDNFTERGVGTLYLKPVKDSGKTQLLVRADTNLGNILVNLILNEGIPAQRMGKNNVMLFCLPLPDGGKPTPMLLRVKTEEEADKLLEVIEKYKK